MSVRALPPSPSRSKNVSTLSRYGTCVVPRLPAAASALITAPSVASELLIAPASLS